MRARTWRWLRARILGLLGIESRLYYALKPPERKKPNLRIVK